MKKSRSTPANQRGRQVACTVSAAALMLGVSQAATVGLKFTVDYCGFANYVNYVNATAFGVPMNQWQNLTAMGTGYNTCSGTTYYELSEVIDTTTSTGGLHPLPNGSLTINWGGATANWSGFKGYDSGTPPQPITSGPPVPEAQVYAGFIRDGVNFGPGSSGGNNNQPGYSIDVTGLKSLFTNSSFAVQLVAAADSMQYLTNAFIIDATLNTTQSVVYPSTQVYGNVGDTAWYRAIGGGLSTGSGAFNTDHLKIIGNRAFHTAGPPAVNFASTISGAIITDKPVVTMSPRSVLASPADMVALSAYAVGVPPLSYQWRLNGRAVSGATALQYTILKATAADGGTYDLVVTNAYGSATSSVAVVTVDQIAASGGRNYVFDSNPQNTEHDGLNWGATWQAASADALGTNRTGVMSFNASATNQIQVPTGLGFNSTSGTIMFWMRSSGVSDPTGNPATLLDRRNGKNGAGMVLALNPDGSLDFECNNGSGPASFGNIADGNWHHIALTYDQTSGNLDSIYIDGQFIGPAVNTTAWSWNVGQDILLGASNDHADWQPFNGRMDDVRVYSRILNSTEIASAFTGALVDQSALGLRLNFDAAPTSGVTLRYQCPDAILQMSPTVNGSYTDLPTGGSPYAVSARSAAKFFRYRGHTPTNIVSNPYLM